VKPTAQTALKERLAQSDEKKRKVSSKEVLQTIPHNREEEKRDGKDTLDEHRHAPIAPASVFIVAAAEDCICRSRDEAQRSANNSHRVGGGDKESLRPCRDSIGRRQPRRTARCGNSIFEFKLASNTKQNKGEGTRHKRESRKFAIMSKWDNIFGVIIALEDEYMTAESKSIFSHSPEASLNNNKAPNPTPKKEKDKLIDDIDNNNDNNNTEKDKYRECE